MVKHICWANFEDIISITGTWNMWNGWVMNCISFIHHSSISGACDINDFAGTKCKKKYFYSWLNMLDLRPDPRPRYTRFACHHTRGRGLTLSRQKNNSNMKFSRVKSSACLTQYLYWYSWQNCGSVILSGGGGVWRPQSPGKNTARYADMWWLSFMWGIVIIVRSWQ